MARKEKDSNLYREPAPGKSTAIAYAINGEKWVDRLSKFNFASGSASVAGALIFPGPHSPWFLYEGGTQIVAGVMTRLHLRSVRKARKHLEDEMAGMVPATA